MGYELTLAESSSVIEASKWIINNLDTWQNQEAICNQFNSRYKDSDKIYLDSAEKLKLRYFYRQLSKHKMDLQWLDIKASIINEDLLGIFLKYPNSSAKFDHYMIVWTIV